MEASESELWTRWLLPHYPAAKIRPLAGRLTRLWRDHDGRRIPRADARETIVELHRRGYLLGIIANTITETEIPDWMESDGVTDYFQTVILSSRVGYRNLTRQFTGWQPGKLGWNPSSVPTWETIPSGMWKAHAPQGSV